MSVQALKAYYDRVSAENPDSIAPYGFRVPDRGSVNPTALAGMGSETHSCHREEDGWARLRHRQGCVFTASSEARLLELQVRRRADRSGFEP